MSSTIEIQKKCEWCGIIFTARKTTTAYCCHRCANLAYKDKKRKQKVETVQQKCNEEIKKSWGLENEFLTPTQAAKLLGLSRATMYRYMADEIIKSVQFKRKTLIRRRDIDNLFESSSNYRKNPPKEKVPKPIKPQYYTVIEVMERFNMSRDKIYHYVKVYKISKVREERYTKISKPEMDKLFESLKTD